MSSDFAIKASPSGSKSEYVYLQKSGPICYNEESLKDVYNLKVDYLSLGILLDSGVIPTPHSPYKDFYVLNAGDDLVVNSTNGSVITSSNFHYTRTDSAKKNYSEMEFESELIGALRRNLADNSPLLLFLSGGKDSATLACGLSKLETDRDIHCITYRSNFQDESAIAERITKKLNLSHEIVDIGDYKVKFNEIESFFTEQFSPSLDLCSTIYMHCGLDRYRKSTLLDGMGNDLFVGHVPSKMEYRTALIQKLVPYWMKRSLGRMRGIHKAFMLASKTRSEMVGFWTFLSGLSLIDDLAPYHLRRSYWESIDREYRNIGYLDVRASLRGRYIDQEKFIRKIKNAARAYDLSLSLPWTDPAFATYCHNLVDRDLFDGRNLKNKIFLRKYLTSNLDIDYFSEPKYAFAYNYSQFVEANISYIKEIILDNELFEKRLTEKYFNLALKDKNYGLIYQLFLFLAWYRFSRYIKR